MKIRTLAALAFLTVSSVAYAQPITDSFTYQGTLNDLGVPANGTYDLGFLVYDDPIAGNIVPGGSAGADNVEIVDGLFQAFVDFGISGVLFNTDQTRWLQIVVKRDSDEVYIPIGPRQRMAPTPVANYALQSGTTLQDAYLNNPDIYMEQGTGIINIHSAANQDAAIRIFNEFGDPRAVYFENGFGYGDYLIYGTGTNIISRLYNDTSIGGGGQLFLARNDSGDAGITLQGNHQGTHSPRLTLQGVAGSIDFNSFFIGDAAVTVPTGSINSVEILNEVGAAETSRNSSVNLTENLTTIDVLDSVTISCPTDGIVLVLSTCELSIVHVTGTTSAVDIGVSAFPGSLPGNGDLETAIDNNAPSGRYDHVVTTHAIFQVSQGSNTFYQNGDKNFLGGSATSFDSQLSAIFIPTSYGNIIRDSGNALDDEFAPQSGPMTQIDILREQNAALQANAERQQREIDEMRAQMESIVSSLQEHDPQETGIE